jgi:type II protein arginine methyltransferase
MTDSPNLDARLKAAVALHTAGHLDEAEAAYHDILAEQPAHGDALKHLALIALTRGAFDEAEELMTAAVAAVPAVGDYWHLLGRIRMELGDLDAAADDLVRALHRQPQDMVGCRLDLSLCHARRGAWPQSLAVAERLLATQPDNIFALRAAATAHLSMNRLDKAEEIYRKTVTTHPNDAGGWEGLAVIARKRGQTHLALTQYDMAVQLEPDNADYAYMRRVVAAEMVPGWHFNMMNDTARNQAFAAAIARQVEPDSLVLEIGTGSGLLAMMAARAGARVVTCEANPAIAITAREIIARNGLSDRITVINKASWELAVGADLPRPADVLIAEIFSAQLLSEDVIPSLEDAKARLCAPEVAVIPAIGVMRGALVHSPSLDALTRVGTVEGFDISAFNTYTPPLMNLDAPNYALEWLSEPLDLFSFSFQADDKWPAGSNIVDVPVTRSGLCHGVVQWLWLAVDDATTYENPPLGPAGTRTPHWTPLLYTPPAPFALKKGQTVRLRVAHDRKGARVDFVAVGGG